ncbi:uncharacterized protein LOC108433603 isoform X3 [Pygocentrus nattereri]|uniref:uncharacterized protein LOC108433603 isoform X3 n=1 Tax=Pygocentrus nattereri TaxID=42514 RepID=UPI001890EBFC|nr:uncharacterized protein LOC108433603 isoform X3 [Pygocentrus nattereri]
MDMSLAALPLDLDQELRLSREMLSQTLPKGCTMPVPVGVCKKTKVDAPSICQGVVGSPLLQSQVTFGNVSAQLCNFSISQYACSSVAALSSRDLGKVMACKLTSSMNYSRAIWSLFFQKFAAPLDEALDAYSNMTHNISLPDPYVLDAMSEVKLNNFSNAQLTDSVFITKWFQTRLRPFLSSVSVDFLSCLSSKNFSCQTYQVVVEALSRQDQLMEEEQKWSIFTYFIYPFLSRDDLSDPSCVSSTSGSSDWLAKNFGNFSAYASLEELLILNIHFSSLDSLDLLNPSQVAEVTLTSGPLNSTSQMDQVFDRLEKGDAFKNVDEFFTALTEQAQVAHINPAVRDVMMNRTFEIISIEFPHFVTLEWIEWFKVKLTPVLPSFTAEMLVTAINNTNCTNYRVIVSGISAAFYKMTESNREEITKALVKYLKDFAAQLNTPICRKDIQSDSEWLSVNLGLFSTTADYSDLKALNISGVVVLDSLSAQQKAELILDPSSGALENETLVKEVMMGILSSSGKEQLDVFFETFCNITKSRNITMIPPAVSETFLNMTLLALVPRFQTFSAQDFALWFQTYLHLFLPGIGPNTLAVIPKNISCNSYKEIVKGFNSVYSDLSESQSGHIFSFIQDYLQHQSSQGPNGLGCYSGGSFYVFLRNFFLSFGFPDLSAFLSLIPGSRQQELLGSISPAELSVFLNGPNTVRNGSDLCTLLNNYNSTNQYLQTQPVVSAAVGRQTLGCVWSHALSASSQDEVDQWFNVRLAQYLPLLSSQLISPTQLSGASCLSYRKLVSVLGNSYNYSATDFTPAVVYSSIKAYLNSSDGSPRCYNSSDPLLNSTAWFANNIGSFITFISLTDLQSFVSESQISVFLENSENIQLFNNSQIAANVTTYYGMQLYIQNPNYNPFRLPGVLLCGAPASVFVSIGAAVSETFLEIISKFCSGIDPQVSTALVANLPTLSTSTIQMLGNQSIGLTQGQISSAPPALINSSLSMLSNVPGWNQGQVNLLIQILIRAGFNINSASSLVNLGTLIGGILSATISSIPSSQLLTISQNPTFINNILSAPVILQQTYVQKIVSVDQNKVVENVPDALAAYIQPMLLAYLKVVNVTLINKKSWSQQQAAVMFGAVSRATEDTEGLSESILQGFTCRAVQNIPLQKVKQLVRACRPRTGRKKVVLKESQLTCMHRYVKDDSFLTFTDFPSDMLLYYSYEKVQKVNCRSYFIALSGADFSVLSSVLNRQSILFKNAQNCLGISDQRSSLTSDQVQVLGNMACTLNSSYIQNSHPLILEKLKNCGDLSDSQVTAVQMLLYTGNTPYGNPSVWNQQTLQQLGILPLYLKQDFWSRFSSSVRKRFLRSFLPFLRRRKTQKWKLSRLFKAYMPVRFTRSADCTVGNITAVTTADEAFTFDYDSTQFDLCLDITVLNDNLAAITDKVVDASFQLVILDKLNQLYPSGLPESVVQLLGSTSRAATVDDISKWNITTIDTLASLMNSDNGDWTSDQSAAVIMRYLSVSGNSLGTAEINAVGSYLCSLDVSVLKNITADSLRNANALDISSCSTDQKSVLYSIANSSFSTELSNPVAYYELISPYLGGAPLEDIQVQSTLNISMDIDTFISLNPAVVVALSVSTVRDLMGINVADLKLFENSPVVQSWEAQQKQSDLNTLNIGLQSGIPDIVSSTSVPITSTASINSDNNNNNITSTIASTSITASNNQNNTYTSVSTNGTATATVTNTITTSPTVNTTSVTAFAGINSTVSTAFSVNITSINSSATTTSSANTTVTTITSVNNTVNSTDSHVSAHTGINATTVSVNTTVPTPVSDNTTITIAAVNTTTVNTMNGNGNNTSVNATTPSISTTATATASSNTTTTANLNATVTPIAGANTTITIATANTTTVNPINGNVNASSINATTASLNTTVTSTASSNTTITVASANSTTVSPINGNVNASSINATTASLNTTVTSTASTNTTITVASANTTTVSPINGNVNASSINATTASLNTTVTSTASINTTITVASANTTTVSPINGNVNASSVNATTASLNTTVTSTASTNTTITVASANTTTVSPINGNVNASSINATTASLNTTVTSTASINTTITVASANTTTVSPINGNVNASSVNATTASLNTTVTSTASTNTTITVASANTTTVSPINGNVNASSINATTASLNTTVTGSASATITVTSGNATKGNINNSQISANTTATTTVTNSNATTGIITTTITGVTSVTIASATTTAQKNFCQGVDSHRLETHLLSGDLSAVICNFTISDFACSSVTSLSSNDLASLLTCRPQSNVGYSKQIWVLFFQRYSASLDDALDKYSSMASNINRPDTYILDAIGEVIVNNFSAVQLADTTFITEWFQIRLRPFLSTASTDFLSSLSSKDFSCQTYQIVVEALGMQAPLMEEKEKMSIVTSFIYPFLSKDGLPDPGCVSSASGNSDWLAKNFGEFSTYASLEQLRRLNTNFSSLGSLQLLTPSQAAELTLTSGALNSTSQMDQVFSRLEKGNAFKNVDEFFTTFNTQKVANITPAVRDVMMNRTFKIVSTEFQKFETSDWIEWFEVKLTPVLSSFTAEMLVTTINNINCSNYQVVVRGLSSVSDEMVEFRKQELAAVLMAHLKQSIQQFSQPACRVNIQTDADWLTTNLGYFSSYVSSAQLKEFNISWLAVLDVLTGEQKAQLILQPGSGLMEKSVVQEVFSSVLMSSDQKQLGNFFTAFSQSAIQMNVTSIPPAVSDLILNMTLQALVPQFKTFSSQDFALWFQTYLRLFLPGIGPNSLSVIPRNISCNSYRAIVKGLDNVYSDLSTTQSKTVFSYTMDYLKHQSNQGQSCVQSVSNDTDWLVKNFGQFRSFTSFSDIISLKSDFNGVKAADVLTSSQLAELCSNPSQLHGPQDVDTVMAAISLNQFASFFDVVTPNILLNSSLYSSEVKEAFLQTVLVRGGLSSAAVADSEVQQWVNVRLRPLLSSLSSADVTPYFNIIRGRSCNTRQTAVSSLDSVRSSLSSDTQTQIYSNIQQLLTGPNGLGCYSGGSFYAFLKNSFLSFGFPDLSTFLSLIPGSRQQELLGSISPAELSVFLNGPNTVRNGSDLCTLLNNYNSTNQYLQTQPVVSAAVGRQTLGCVWSRALSASSQDEVDQWFNVRLAQYLPLLSSQLISPIQLSGASCLSYRKLISVLGKNYNFSGTDFTPADVYSSIKAYLNSIDGSPQCYNSSDPLLNSTAWFANNIGFFITFISLTDLQSFVSDSQISVFLSNPENLQLFNNSRVAANVTTYYGTQLFIQNPNFSPLSLPGVLLCGAPGSAFVSLKGADSQTILDSIKKSCQRISPEVTAALVANFPTLTANTIQSLGNQSVSLTEGQISAASPSVINSTLPVLSFITGWNQGQVNNIIQSITNAGFSINSGSSLVTLGTLIAGVPSAAISSISSTELLTVSQNPTFIINVLSAPVILQETYVQKIVSVDQTKVVENVPDALAGYIPPVLLSSPTSVNVTLINKKSWRPEQAVVLFSSVASASDNTEELSESILQGFTCSSVQKLPWSKVTQLVRACRPRAGRNKVFLKEPQLTCMYNYMKYDSSLNFTDLPADMLLYYSYEKVQKVNCRSYFSAVGGADFSVLSSVLNRQSILFQNAQNCLGISGVSLNSTQVEVLGNMACTLDSTYIQNSDPLILEKLKNCGDLSDSQVTAIQTLLYTGNTTYGNRSSWNLDTLNKLGILPLYLKQAFWTNFDSTTKKTFLKTFIPSLKKQKIQISKLRRFFTESTVNVKVGTRTKTVCATDNNITEATIADPSFPAGYDSTQFDACLDNAFLKDNLAAITEKVVDTGFLTIILNKLNQLYASGLPESVVQLLSAVSRVATVSDISKWNITAIDTLSFLMVSDNGAWTSEQSKAVITRYLSVAGNILGTAELNAIGSYLCSLDLNVLKTVTADSLKKANSVNVSSCSIDQKSALYSIANSSFSTQRSEPTAFYQLISSYLGGAPVEDIRALSAQNISMDINTFMSLSPAVLTTLSVNTVRSLLGMNLDSLKLFENTTAVRSWTDQQYKSELATLNIGLVGGKDDPVSSTTNVTVPPTNTSTTQTNYTVNATTQSSAVVHRGSGLWLISLCVGLLTITLHTLQ